MLNSDHLYLYNIAGSFYTMTTAIAISIHFYGLSLFQIEILLTH